MMWDCPLCGAKSDGDSGVCQRCGYTDRNIGLPPKDAPAKIDIAAERKKDYRRAIEERKAVLLLKLQSLDLANSPLVDIKHTISEVLTGLDVPLKIGSEYRVTLDAKDKDIVNALERIISAIDYKLLESADSPETFVRFGNLEYGIGEYLKALNYYENALVSQPNHHIALYNRGMTLFYLHRYAESVKCLKKLIKLAPKNDAAHKFLGLAEQMVIDKEHGT